MAHPANTSEQRADVSERARARVHGCGCRGVVCLSASLAISCAESELSTSTVGEDHGDHHIQHKKARVECSVPKSITTTRRMG